MPYTEDEQIRLECDTKELYLEIIDSVIEQDEPVSIRTVNDELVYNETGAKASALLRRAFKEGKLSRGKRSGDKSFRYAKPDYV